LFSDAQIVLKSELIKISKPQKSHFFQGTLDEKRNVCHDSLRGKFTLACSVWMCLKAGVVVVVVAVVAGVQLLLWK